MILILYQDDNILFCCKPPGLLSQSGPGPNMPDRLLEETGKPVYPVHRLDRGVGGVMVYARSQNAAAALSNAVRRGDLQKEYLCIVQNVPEQPAGTYRDLLFHDKTRNKSFVVNRMRGGVREASLSYQMLETDGEVSLVRVRLHTGRTHQIRVQFASRGTPLLGDGKYGGRNGEIALWSYSLSLPHPKTQKTLCFQLPPEGGPWERFQESITKIIECTNTTNTDVSE